MTQAQQDVLAIERELPPLRQDCERKGQRLRDLQQESAPVETLRRALQNFHDASLAWLNGYERLIAVASLSGADQDPTWYTHHAETAVNLMETIPKHYAAVFAVAQQLGIPRETLKPSPTSFSGLQRCAAALQPESSVANFRAAFAAQGLPTVGFDVKESCKLPVSRADLVLVTVNDHETRAVLDAFLEATGEEAKPVTLGDRLYHDLGKVNGTTVYHAISEMGSGGSGGMQQTVEKAVNAISPAAVIAVGIAFGVNEEKQAIGDIIVSKLLRLYDLQRIGKRSKIVLRGARPDASPRLMSHFRGFSQTKWQGAKVRVGVILTGDKLIDNVDYRDQLVKFESEAVGGEMEGAGLYVSSYDNKVDWIVIKAICDWADGNKDVDKEARQKLAAKNAAEFVVGSLKYASLKRV